MINPTSYERYGEPLFGAAEIATLGVGAALSYVLGRAVQNPDAVHDLEGQFMQAAREQASLFESSWQDWASEELAKAYIRGIRHTDAELRQLENRIVIPPPTRDISPGTPILKRQPSTQQPLSQSEGQRFRNYAKHTKYYGVFKAAAHEGLEGTHSQIIRYSQDVYRRTAIAVGDASFREGNTLTRVDIAQRQLDDYARQGIKGITYRNGRNFPLDAYAEMVGRTMSGHAAIQASLNRYEEYGYDLVRISSHFRACDMCTPWEGIILTQSGNDARYYTLEEAIASGLFHPNCAHDINPYFEGISPEQEVRVDPAERALIDEYGYEQAQEVAYNAQQQQRAIEREIRKAKRQEATGLTQRDKEDSKAKVNQLQARQREHLEKYPYLPRKYVREQVKTAH